MPNQYGFTLHLWEKTFYSNVQLMYNSIPVSNESVADTRGGGEGGLAPPPIIFTEALVLKSGSTRKFSFQGVEPLLVI